MSHLVEKVLYKRSYSNVVEVTVDQKKLGQELKPGDCIVTVSHSLTTLASHDTWKQLKGKTIRMEKLVTDVSVQRPVFTYPHVGFLYHTDIIGSIPNS